MTNKEINIPIFKVKHLIIAFSVLVLVSLNLIQWYFNKDNNINIKSYKQREKVITSKIDSIKNINLLLEKDLILKDTLLLFYQKEKSRQNNLRKYYKNEYKKALSNYNSLNRTDRLNSVKDILAK